MTQSYGSTYDPRPVEALGENARAGFVVRTYNHLFAAIVGFVAVEYVFFTTGLAEVMAQAMLGTNWLLVLGGFILVSWLATRTAHNAVSLRSQYLALALSWPRWSSSCQCSTSRRTTPRAVSLRARRP